MKWFYESPSGQAIIFEEDGEGDISISPQALVELSLGAPEGFDPVKMPSGYLLDYLEGLGYKAAK